MKILAIAAALLVGGCYDSLVSNRCQPGLVAIDGVCVPESPDGSVGGGADAPGGGNPDGGIGSNLPDAGTGSTPDAGTGSNPDAAPPVCAPTEEICDDACTDVQHDRNHCGACGIVCESGLCEDGVCLGDVAGHVVLIGQDYAVHHAPAVRLLGDAISLGAGSPLAVGIYQGSADPIVAASARAALDDGMAATGRFWAPVELGATPFADLTGIGTVVILPQRAGDGGEQLALDGAAWSNQMKAFVARGGVIVALEGAQDYTYRLLVAGDVMSIGAPHAVTGNALFVVAASDGCAIGVASPYKADPTSVAWDGVTSDVVVVADPAGGAVVVHGTR